MAVTSLTSKSARLDVTIDGLRFLRSDSDAERRGVERDLCVGWDDVRGVRVETTRKGRQVLRVQVTDAPAPADHRVDPHSFKTSGHDAEALPEVVARIEQEIEVRRRWRRQRAATGGTAPADTGHVPLRPTTEPAPAMAGGGS